MRSPESEKRQDAGAKPYYFCTYFDQHYLPRALALYQSLLRNCPHFHLFVLCMDRGAHRTFEALDLAQTTAISLDQLEHANQELRQVKKTRSRVEYYYTCGPSFLLYLLNCYPYLDLINYLDADLFFFADPKPLFDELEGCSVGIIEHRLPKRLAKFKRFGTYNVGWVSFRHDEYGLECLRWWAERCIEWCYDRVEGERFADQKYLDEFPVRFKSVGVMQHKGANLAPWNVANYRISDRDNRIWVDEQPLIFFHFQGFRIVAPWLFDTNFGWYHASPSSVVRRKIFGPYIRELRRISCEVGPVRSLRDSNRNRSRGVGILVRSARTAGQVSLGLIRRAYIVSFRYTVL